MTLHDYIATFRCAFRRQSAKETTNLKGVLSGELNACFATVSIGSKVLSHRFPFTRIDPVSRVDEKSH